MCIAQLVRDINVDLWSPDIACDAVPALLVSEPPVADTYESADGRRWCRVYLDGSVLDQDGRIEPRAPRAAAGRRFDVELLAA